jgi:hypothetical protein
MPPALFGRLAKLPYQRPTVHAFSRDRASRHLSNAMEPGLKGSNQTPECSRRSSPVTKLFGLMRMLGWPLARTKHEAHILRD